MGRLHNFWNALDEIHGHSASMIEWRKRLGPDSEFGCRYLQATNRLAASAPISEDLSAPYYRLTCFGNGEVEANSPFGDGPVMLEKADVVIWRVAFQALCAAIANALDINFAYEKTKEISVCHRIGAFQPYAGRHYPVFLVCSTTPEDSARAIELLALQWTENFIVVVPTLRFVRSPIELLMRERKAGLLVLSRSVAVDESGQLVSLPEGRSTLSAFVDSVIPVKPGEPRSLSFPTPADAGWHDVRMKFIDGEAITVSIRGVSKRLTYVEMGMNYARAAKPTKQWELLREFARGYGWLDWKSPGADRKNESRRSQLSKALQEFFGIEGDPIAFEKAPSKGWRTLFAIQPD